MKNFSHRKGLNIGASVVVKGVPNGVITDFDGKFSIQNIPDDATIQISFVGYKTQDILVKGKNYFNITLIAKSAKPQTNQGKGSRERYMQG